MQEDEIFITDVSEEVNEEAVAVMSTCHCSN